MPNQSLPRPLSDTDLEIKTACAYRDLVKFAGRAVIDYRSTLNGWDRYGRVIQDAVLEVVLRLTVPHDLHESVTQFYRAEVRRLRAELELKELIIQQLGQAVAGREMVGAR